jgi:hypothetical protein
LRILVQVHDEEGEQLPKTYSTIINIINTGLRHLLRSTAV